MMFFYNETFYFENYKLIVRDGRCENCYFHNSGDCGGLVCLSERGSTIFELYENF